MGNLRSNGENGSTVRSPNQDSVIGQISPFSLSFLRFCTVSNKTFYSLFKYHGVKNRTVAYLPF